MWRIAEWESKHRLWFSDGEPVDALRPIDNFETRAGLSCRLIVDKLGFLDLTEIPSTTRVALDANGFVLESAPNNRLDTKEPMELSIQINEHDKTVITTIIPKEEPCPGEDIEYLYIPQRPPSTSIPLKPLPTPCPSDIKFLKSMIDKAYIPYQSPPPGGKDIGTITRLGKQFFPFTNDSAELAICIYDWTTASFVRNVLFKIFEYTGHVEHSYFSSSLFSLFSSSSSSSSSRNPHHPLDLESIAYQIYTSNWAQYTPSNEAYMNSFMMKPATSLSEVSNQLAKVSRQVHRLSDVENRIMSLAVASLPRVSVFNKPVVYSGQLDMRQLSLNHFGIEFLECHVNDFPVGKTLRIDLEEFLGGYVTPGKILTNKAFLSFTDEMDLAMKYSNGLLLVVRPGRGSCVWEQMSLVTSLAVDGEIEYTFLPGTRFEFERVEREDEGGREIIVIEMRVVSED